MKQRDDSKTETIFAATLELVLEMGVAGITMRQIATKSGIATGTLYIYFKDKEALVNELYHKCRAASVQSYFEGYDSGTRFETCFNVIWKNILAYRLKNFKESVFMEQCYHSPYITGSTKEKSLHLIKPLTDLIERGKRERILKDMDTKLLLIFMMGSITELIKFTKYTNKRITQETIESAMTICWDGLKR